MITGGADVLDALIAGVTLVELDPDDTSVGCGGLPIEKRLLSARGFPNFGLNSQVLNVRGDYAGVSMYASTFAV